jgi:hypothetical protein
MKNKEMIHFATAVAPIISDNYISRTKWAAELKQDLLDGFEFFDHVIPAAIGHRDALARVASTNFAAAAADPRGLPAP